MEHGSEITGQKFISDYLLFLIEDLMAIVSVILPIYNVESYLKECLDSLIKQSFSDIEIICIDDGSKDNSYKILENFSSQDPRIKIFKQNNQGAAFARNFGLSVAKGRYIIFLDSDDYFEHQLIEKTVRVADNSSSDIVIFKAQAFDENSGKKFDLTYKMDKYTNYQYSPFSSKDLPNDILNTFLPAAWNKLYRKSFIDQNHFEFQNIKRTNDLLFTCKTLIKAQRIVLLNEFLLFYRIRPTNSLQATNTKTPLEFLKALIALKGFLDEQGVFSLYLRSYLALLADVLFYNIKSVKSDSNKYKIINYLKRTGYEQLGLNKINRFFFVNLYAFIQYKVISSNLYNKIFLLKINRAVFKIFNSLMHLGLKNTINRIRENFR